MRLFYLFYSLFVQIDSQNNFEKIIIYNTRYGDLFYDFPICQVTFYFF